MGKIIQFPLSPAPEKFGLQRARLKKVKGGGKHAQLDLFSGAKIVRFNQLSVFEEALLMDERGESAQARRGYLKAIEAEDCAADAYCNLGIIESREGDYPKAIDCFTLCLKLNPRHYEAHYNLANLYSEVGNLPLAKLHYGTAIELEPDFPSSYYNLGLTHAVLKEYREAVAFLRQYRDRASAEEKKQTDDLIDKLSSTFS